MKYNKYINGIKEETFMGINHAIIRTASGHFVPSAGEDTQSQNLLGRIKNTVAYLAGYSSIEKISHRPAYVKLANEGPSLERKEGQRKFVFTPPPVTEKRVQFAGKDYEQNSFRGRIENSAGTVKTLIVAIKTDKNPQNRAVKAEILKQHVSTLAYFYQKIRSVKTATSTRVGTAYEQMCHIVKHLHQLYTQTKELLPTLPTIMPRGRPNLSFAAPLKWTLALWSKMKQGEILELAKTEAEQLTGHVEHLLDTQGAAMLLGKYSKLTPTTPIHSGLINADFVKRLRMLTVEKALQLNLEISQDYARNTVTTAQIQHKEAAFFAFLDKMLKIDTWVQKMISTKLSAPSFQSKNTWLLQELSGDIQQAVYLYHKELKCGEPRPILPSVI